MAVTETIKHAVGMDATPSSPASREEMSAARLPLPYRDSCAHLLIPLNQCRFREWYLPWKCEVRTILFRSGEVLKASKNLEEANFSGLHAQDEKHSYEKCQFAEYTRRVIKQNEIREAKGGARSN